MTLPGTTTTPPRTEHPRPSALLAVLCVATFMSGLDIFVVNVALRPIGSALGETSLAHLSWVLNAYAILFGALLVPAGRLADRYGVKGTFLFGLAVFTAGSLGDALSGDLWVLVALRCVQAVGAAALVPTSLGLVLTGMPPERVKRSVQIWSIAGSIGAAAGPAVGGLLVEASWRWIFIINVPIGIAAFIAAVVLAPDARHNRETGIPDPLGGALLVVGIGALSLALIQGPDWGWAGLRTLGAFAAALASLALFVLRSLRAKVPVVNLELFGNRNFSWANVANFSLSIGFGIQLLGMVLWLQEGWGWSAVRTGLCIAPGPVMVSVTALGLRRFTSKLPEGLVAVAGALVMALGGLLIGTSVTARPPLPQRSAARVADHRRRRRPRRPHADHGGQRPPRSAPDVHRQRHRPDGPADRQRPRRGGARGRRGLVPADRPRSVPLHRQLVVGRGLHPARLAHLARAADPSAGRARRRRTAGQDRCRLDV